jgi:hypothetical protein
MRLAFALFLVVSTAEALAQVRFTPEFKQANRGKWTVEVPEVQELVHIVFALTERGQKDNNMVQHEGSYYQEVMRHFLLFKNQRLIKDFNDELNRGMYARLKMDACGFYFDNDHIVRDKTYDQLNWDNKNHLEKFIPKLEVFAQLSGFRKFFEAHQSFYQTQIELAKKQMPIDRQWKWLEERFPQRYDHYRITFSPLVNGSHSTNRFMTDDFKQTVMFICGPIESLWLNDNVKEGLMTRVVFTEIDHNYVNPTTDRFSIRIDKIFDDRKKWTGQGDALNYKTPYMVFNEYMTWAVFTLYAYDHFEPADFDAINVRTEKLMTERRGFIKFREFNAALLALYKARQGNQTIPDLYPAILTWCEAAP